jgi:PAS domain S-box-containing protein
MGSTATELQLWTDPTDRVRMIETLARDGMVRNLEIEFQSSNHTRIPTLISASMIKLGSELCVVAYIRDITARKRIEQDLLAAREEMSRHVKALSASEETFRKLFDANLDSMTLTGPDGNYINVNREFVRSTGFSREETIGRHFTELNLWIHPDEMITFANELVSANQVRNVEMAFRNKDGSERPVLISAINLELHGQLCCLTISRDIADIKMTQRELVAAREAALAASRAKSEFLSSMSHEIRTPMNAILGMADLLAETELGDEQRRYVNTVVSNGNALLELINGILDLAKVESGRISLEAVEFDPKEVTEKVLETLAIRAHEKGLELMARFAPGLPDAAIGDPLRLGQILINLVGNAIKFTQSGQVLVSVESDPNSTTAGGLKFAVTDTGIGIPADKLHLLFHAFTQADSSTSRKYGGSGLGLAIVSRLVALMHGKVEVASEPGIGSSFSFTAQFGTASTRPALSGSRKPAFGEVGILLVDDNPDSRSILSELLLAQGADVTQVSSGKEALAELRRDGSRESPFQIILLDGTMPVMGGFDVAKHLMGGMPGRPQIVMMLGTDDLTSKLGRLRALGVDNYIVKPVRRADLFAAVARAREGVRLEPRGDTLASRAIVPMSASSATLDRAHTLSLSTIRTTTAR